MKAISEDLRNRIVVLISKGESQRQIANRLMISQGTVWKINKLYKTTGKVEVRPRPGRPRSFKGRSLRALEKYVIKQPDATLAEIETHFKNRNIPCSSTSIKNAFRLLKISYKKNSLCASARKA